MQENLIRKSSELSISSQITENHIPIAKPRPQAQTSSKKFPVKTANREFIAAKMRIGLRQIHDKGFVDSVSSLVTVPLNFIRDYSIPMSEDQTWNKTRAAIIPLTLPTAMAIITGNLNLFATTEEEQEAVS